MSEIDLSNLDGTDGFVLTVSARHRLGFSVDIKGDFNGDGFDDVLIGNPDYAIRGERDIGSVYLIFGDDLGFAPSLDLDDIGLSGGPQGHIIRGNQPRSEYGFSISSIDDFNGDGFSDIIIGAPKYGDEFSAGQATVVFGGNSHGTVIRLDKLSPDEGFVVRPTDAYSDFGEEISNAGDINADGFDDIIISRDKVDPRKVETFVLLGREETILGPLNSTKIKSDNGFQIRDLGEGSAGVGFSVSSAGDINGDGIDDIVMGAFNDYSSAIVIFGKSGDEQQAIDVSDLDKSTGFKIIDREGGARFFAGAVSNAEDVNGDGVDDLIIGSESGSGLGKIDPGVTYVIFGNEAGFPALLEIGDLDGSNGFSLVGVRPGDNSGDAVHAAGDVNADGLADIIIGAYDADGSVGGEAGEAYVVFGSVGGFPKELDLESLDASNGITIPGINRGDALGWDVGGGGDINGDGFDDVIVGEPFGFPGKGYVIFGFDTGAVTQLGDGENNILIGGNEADVLVGGVGDDVLAGGSGGADVLRGAAGDDVLGIGSLSFLRVNGGNGTDTLRIDAENMSLDLTSPVSRRIENIETLHLNNGTNLRLSAISVQNLSQSTNSVGIVGPDTASIIFDDPGWFGAAAEAGARMLINGAARVTLDADLPFVVTARNAPDKLIGSSSNDEIKSLAGDDRLFGQGGDDFLDGGAGADKLDGGAGNDVFVVDDAGDVLKEESGVDTVLSSISFSLAGGFENLSLVAAGDQEVSGKGNSLSNSITGSRGANRIEGGGGDDVILGKRGADQLIGNSGNDVLVGGDGSDLLHGGVDDDLLKGGSDDDRLIGFTGNDLLIGGDGNDVLRGGAGNDRIYGKDGLDRIVGGIGRDVLIGGADADVFVLEPGSSIDTIKDFTLGIDLLDVSGFGFADFTAISAVIKEKNGRAQINLDSFDDVVRLNGVLTADLSAGDFIFE